ncbi:MAG: non-canonical purine NTP diphosphatase [Bacteroidales bacterium]
MNGLVFATNNQHKLKEVKELVGDRFRILSLEEIGCLEDIPETAETLEGNALIKARHVKEKYGYDCFADDTGLEIAALNNAPGVYSARYAGEDKDPKANMCRVLDELAGKSQREARFRTVIAFSFGEKEMLFEGIVNGEIAETESGYEGFGYDPIFVPEGYEVTFAEMPSQEKNRISHRGRAVRAFIDYLKTLES